MARPKKTDAPDLSGSHELTVGAIDRLTCPSGKQQAFLRDSKAPGLRVRVTVAGAKSYVFEAKLNRQTIRRTIGDVRAWTIEQARQADRFASDADMSLEGAAARPAPGGTGIGRQPQIGGGAKSQPVAGQRQDRGSGHVTPPAIHLAPL